MAKQTAPKSTLSSASFQLQTLDATNYYTATLSGGFGTSASSHTSIISPLLTNLSGDSLTGTGNLSTLIAGAGRDSLLALGSQEFLQSGTGIDTLVARGNGVTLAGNGLSSLSASGSFTTFLLTGNGDTIAASKGTNDTISLAASLSTASFSMTDIAHHGAGVLNVSNLGYAGSGNVTLMGNTLNNSIKGGSGNDYLAGGGGLDTLDASSSTGSVTLVGGTNGPNTLIGGSGTNSFYTFNSKDLISAQTGSINNVFSNNATLDFSAISSAFHFNEISYTGAGLTTLAGNGQVAITLNAGISTGASITGTSFDDLFNVSASCLVNSVINGNGGTDTLKVGSRGTIGDSAFANISGISVLSLTSASSLTLDVNGASSGISTIYGGSGGDSFVQTANDGLSIDFVGGNSPSNTFNIANSALLTNDTITGGSSNDTLIIGTSDTIIDSAFTNVNGISALSLTSASSLTIGNLGGFAGISTVITGTGADTVDATDFGQSTTLAGAFTINATASTGTTLTGSSYHNDLFQISNATALGNSSITGGIGTDTLQLAQAGSVDDTAFANVFSISAVSLTSASSFSLGSNAYSAGISTVISGVAADTIDASAYTGSITLDAAASATGATLTGSTYNCLFEVSNATALASSSIIGGGGTDTLQLTQAGSITDTAFATTQAISALSLTSTSSVTLGADASLAGITEIYGGSGGDTITQTAADSTPLLIIGGNSAANQYNIANATLLAGDAIFGGASNDTLSIGSAGTIGDTAFANVYAISSLSLTSASSLSIDDHAYSAGITTVITGNGSDTVNASGFGGSVTINATASAGVSLGGSTSSDLFQFSNASALGNSSINGDGGSDTIQVTAPAGLSDAAFASVHGVSALSLSSASSVTLGANAQSSGINSVYGGLGGDTIDQLIADNTATTLLGGTGAANLFEIANSSMLASDSISGGSSSFSNLLVIGSPATLSAGSFANVTNIGILSLTSASAVTLGADALSAGISTIVTGTGADTVNASGFGASISINASASSGTTLTGSASNDFFQIGSPSILSTSSLNGGGGVDTLQITQSGTLGDTLFTNISGVQVLSLTSASSLTLGSNAFNAGFTTVYGGTGGDTLYQTTSDTHATAFIGGSTSANTFIIGNSAMLPNDSIIGGISNDTLIVASSGMITDSSFVHTSGIEALSLTSATSVTLGADAALEGFTSVYGGTGGDTFNQTSADTLSVVFVGGNAPANTFIIANALQLSGDTIAAGSSNDTLTVASSGTLADTSFAHVLGIKALSLTSASSVTLGANAQTAGFTSLYGGTGGDTFVQSSSDTLAMMFVGGASPANSFNIAAASLLANDTIIGGSSNDTLKLTGSGVFADVSFVHETGIKALSLTSATSVTLGANAFAAGFSTIYGGAGGDTITQTSADPRALTLIGGSSSRNTFIVGTQSEFNADSIAGGTSSDILALSFASTNIADSAFSRTRGIGVLDLANGTNSATLSTQAALAGIVNVVGGTANDSINASALSSNITLDGGGSATTFDSLAGGSGVDRFVLASSAATYYGTSRAGIGVSNYAVISNFTSVDKLQLNGLEYTKGHYSLGNTSGGLTESSTHFGLYDSGKFVADITTGGGFNASTLNGGAAFLNPANAHVLYV